MLQPRRRKLILPLLFITSLISTVQGLDDINTSPRRRRQDSNDVTTVLLVDSHGRSSFGRFLSVKPDLGLITSTARTFIQEGVTTEYATQVLGTTLDNGRLYAHLLTKSSRVLYNGDSPSKSPQDSKKLNLEQANVINTNFVRNTDFIAPNQVQAQPVLVFPTATLPLPQSFVERPQSIEEEILEEEPSNNPRVPYENTLKKDIVLPLQNNVKIFKINPQVRDLTQDNIIVHKENAKPAVEGFSPSKVRPWDNLPTFTVRNEFSPSGFSYLGDFPEFDVSTENSKTTTAAERKAKFLFNAGLLKPQAKDLQTITYTGFADFTTTVGDTVIVFSPHTSEVKQRQGQVTKISVQPTIRPSLTLKSPTIGTSIKTFFSQEPGMETQTVEGHKLEMKTSLPTMVIDKTDRLRRPKEEEIGGQTEDMDAKSAVLAHEQHADENTQFLSTSSGKSTIIFTPDLIEPSESQTPMLSTPSHEDIAKIFASLQAQANKQATEPLNTPSTIFLEEKPATEISSGATTIFFENDLPIDNTAVLETPTTSKVVPEEKSTTTTEAETTTTERKTTTEKQTTTTEQIPETTEKLTTTTQKETTTTQKETTTTQKEQETTNVIETTSEHTTSQAQETTPEIVSNEIDTEKPDVVCTDGTQILPTTAYKTLTYLTTFFIPQDDDVTTTSIKSNIVTSTEIGFQTTTCDSELISPTAVSKSVEPTTTTEQEKTTTEEAATTTTEPATTTESLDTTPALENSPTEITTERRHVTESDPETTEMTTESGEEIELIFKTLYTTYTYLTTYFQDTTTSIASKIVVTTNVITSTLVPGSEASDSAVAGIFERDDSLVSSYKAKTISFDDITEITPTKLSDDLLPTVEFTDDVKSTPILNDAKVQQNGVKTYYTTYTYFTTIFVDGETEISSRTEVYTNYVTPSISATASFDDITATSMFVHKDQVESPKTEDDDDIDEDDTQEVKKMILSLNVTPLNSYNSTINRQKTATTKNDIDIYASAKDKLDNNILVTTVNKEQSYVTLQRGTTTTEDAPIDDNVLNLNDYETIATMVTDVRSSTSEGDRRIIENVDKRNVLDDQIVSESNNDSEIIPSPTLLLQTSYTTFTYFTTMYHGTTSSNVVSRLETITNVVTETLTPTHTLSVEDLSLPITYFTTFTYWTTLYKDGTTKVTSREETVSNIVTPTPSLTSDLPTISITPTVTSSSSEATSSQVENIQPSTVGEDDLTTYFTTYTYYTTSYVGDSTVLKSRLETVTNVINSTADIDSNQIGRAIGTASQNKVDEATQSKETESSSSTIKPTGLLSTIVNTVENSGITTILSTDVFGTYIDGLYAKVLESTSSVITPTIAPSSVSEQNLKPTGVVSINKGKIVDAEGVSTLFYTTQAIGTYIDNLYAQVIESTSSLKVNEERKSALATDVPIIHRTGLVRLIEGSIIQNETTTLYQSKVLGTVIDGRYAQIIESTSSFLVGKASSIIPSSVSEIVPTPTKAPDQQIATTATPISPSPVVIEGSLSDSSKIDEESSTEESEEDDDNQDGNTRSKSRLTFSTKKRTFTPVIRPFVSRPRPTFSPKRQQGGPTTATTVTRSDVTPTVTAVPASKPPRFGGRRSSSSANNIVPTASGSKRFSRPKSSSAGGISPSSSFGGGRRSSSRIQPTATGFSSRRGGIRSSGFASPQRASSLFAGNSKFRIRPTLASSLNRATATSTPSSDSESNDLTTQVTDNPTDNIEDSIDTTLPVSTTEASKRNQNPLLRFRRPLARPSTPRPSAKPTKAKGGKVTTTTPKPKSNFNRPNPALNRPRTNSLFPRRNLFTTTTTPAPAEEDEEELEEEGENEDEDTDYDQSQTNTQTEAAPTTPEPRRGRSSNPQIRPFVGFRRRTRREVNYSRFRRPGSRTTPAPATEEPETEAPKPARRFSSRNRSKPTQATTTAPSTRKRISPSKPFNGRSQFTLREKDNPRPTFRRPQSNSNSRTRTTASSRPKSPRLRTSQQQDTKRQTTKRPSRRRNPSGTRQKQTDDNYVIPPFDGTITVTHQIPTEVTIPVVSGKVTEYKNVITAKYSTEILNPKQYSTSANAFGKDVTVLVSEATSIGDNGATLITQFVLNETPTSSVIFTPTYIRGKATSFSHVIPSTAYGVERVVNTIQPALAAQAPLANILLSQLLLGGLQPQNPLLALQNPGFQATPSTEFKTRATTYVTTVTSVTSTVIPLTFRGKEILTTIIDSSVSVVTATEFLTDTIVVTPTFGIGAPAPQLNTLLLPLLQQQLAQAPNVLQPQQPAGVLSVDRPQAQALYQEPDKLNSALEDDASQDLDVVTPPPKRKSGSRKKNKKPTTPAPTEPPKETSVITLYVSGRTPGDFSTVLSTVVVGENDRRRRDIRPVKPSKSLDDLVVGTLDRFDTYVMPATKELSLESTETLPTESLESIIGDVSKHITTQTSQILNTKPTKSSANPSSKKYKIKYVKASEESKQSSGNFLA